MLKVGENDFSKFDRTELLEDPTKYIFEWESDFCYESTDFNVQSKLQSAQNNNDADEFTKIVNNEFDKLNIPAKIVKILDLSGVTSGGWPNIKFHTAKPLTFKEAERLIWDYFDPDFDTSDGVLTLTVYKIVE